MLADVALASGTRTGAARVLRLLHERGLLSDASLGSLNERTLRRDACEGIEHTAASATTPYGNVIVTLQVNGVDIEIANPFAYLHLLCETHIDLFNVVCPGGVNTHRRLLLYIDEVRPGNPLRPDKARQTQCVYWTFSDFPDKLLVDADAWFLLTAVRSTIVDTVPGKVSALTRAIMNVFFASSGTSWTRGILLTSGNSSALLTSEFAGFVADEKALKEIFSLKGASGTKPCPTCANLVQFMEPTGSMIGVSCNNRSAFIKMDDQRFYGFADRLNSHDGSKASLAKLEQSTGITYNPHGILYDDHLRTIVKPVGHYLRDWMHTVVQHGVANTEVGLMMQSLKAHGISHEAVSVYAAAFSRPKAAGSIRADLFAEHRISDDGSMRGFGSELLTMVPLLAAFIEDVVSPRGILETEAVSFKLLADILLILTSGPSVAGGLRRELQVLIDNHHEAFLRAYGGTVCKPKWHHMMHLPEHADAIGKFVSCFVTERKHKTVKGAGNWLFNNYEHTLIRALVHKQVKALGARHLYVDELLLQPRSGTVGGVHIMCSSAARLVCGEVRKGDYVAMCGTRVGFVKSFLEVDGSVFVHVQTFRCTGASCWSPTAAEEIVLASGIVRAVTYAAKRADCIRILPPAVRW